MFLRQHPSLSRAGKGAILCMAASLALAATSTCVFAAVDTDPNLKKLEIKFFQHDYPKDDIETRLNRLEKFVFGETKTGDQDTRLKGLVGTVPNLDEVSTAPTSQASDSGSSSSRTDDTRTSQAPAQDPVDKEIADREQSITGSSNYPAVTAMEKKLLGRDYSSEPVVKRLERLETKAFGKVSNSDDLSDRVDQLKAKTGVDFAHSPPPGSDWADDDEIPQPIGGGELNYHQADATPYQRTQRTPATNLGGGSGSYGGSSGGFGMGGGSSSRFNDGYSAGGSYGYQAPRRSSSAGGTSSPYSDVPRTAPDMVSDNGSTPPTAVGLSQRIAMLENQLFKKSYTSDTLPSRLNRLEDTVFPGQQPSPNMSLPDRVNRLAQVVGVDQPAQPKKRIAQTSPTDFDDPDMPKPAPQRGSGFSKIINGLGNLLGGGSFGAYPMGSSLVTDPQTGYLIDMYSGNVIDPRSGQVVGNRAAMQGGTVPYQGYSTGTVPYAGFNNGLSPLGSPYGGGSSMRFGTGGRGMGFGIGSGGMGFGGMGLGGGMMTPGIWP